VTLLACRAAAYRQRERWVATRREIACQKVTTQRSNAALPARIPQLVDRKSDEPDLAFALELATRPGLLRGRD
jgi:hypothetical protein